MTNNNLIMKIKKSLSDPYSRSIILNYTFKIIGLVLSLFSVSITISYLGSDIYGLWTTIASVISWMSSGDFGIGNGLRNQIAKAYAEGDSNKEKCMIATGLNSLGKVAVVLFFVISLISESLFFLKILDSSLRVPMYITGAFFCINLFLGVANSISYAHQKSWYVTLCNTSGVILTILCVLIFKILGVGSNLNLFAIIHGICITVPNIVLIIFISNKGIPFFNSGIIKNYDKKLLKSIMNVGLVFFGLQICSIILYSTDNVIINYLFDSERVTEYSVITKIYDTGQNLYSVLLIALWSAVTFHAARNDFNWIVSEIKKLLKIWCLYSIGVIVVTILLNHIVRIWLGENAVYYDSRMAMLFCVYGIVISFSAIFVNIVNGLGKLKLQLVLAIIGAIVNIPLSVFFAKYCSLGIFGVKLATLVSVVLGAIAIPIQVHYIIKQKTVLKSE